MQNLTTSLFNFTATNNIIISNIPPDKSISHRAVIFSALAKGNSTITNILNSLDVNNTINCFTQLGVKFNFSVSNTTASNNAVNNVLQVQSNGFGNYTPTSNKINLDMGNSGTSTRLLMGILAGNLLANKNSNTTFTITGDESLLKRPMLRIVEPLRLMGASINFLNSNNTLPLTIQPKQLQGVNYSNVYSAQVKSAIILAGLFANGVTNLSNVSLSRNHTENMLQNLSLPVVSKVDNNFITVQGNPKCMVKAYNYNIPADFSSASFFIALALITPNANITIRNVNINTTRTGLLQVLQQMHANITITNTSNINGEPTADINVKYSNLQACNVSANLVNLMIDEFPILAVICLFAKGVSVFNGINELRYKESDRIQAIEHNFNLMGFNTSSTADSLSVHGLSNLTNNIIHNTNQQLHSFLDHRISMSMLVLASRCIKPITVLNCSNINTSFPNFLQIAQQINWHIL